MNDRNRTILRPALLTLLLLMQGAGCSRPSHEQSAAAFELSDDLGRVILFEAPPRRIVSLAPSLTESLYALGADSLIAGVTAACNHPPQALRHPVVGDLLAPNLERILALDADLILISVEGNTQKSFAAMERMGLRLFVSNPRSMEGVCKSLTDLGRLTARETRATHLVDSLRSLQRTLLAARPTERPATLMLVSTQPIMVAGGGTFLDEIIEVGGGRNAAAGLEGHYPTLSRESILVLDPDVLLYPDDMHLGVSDLISRYPEWKHIGAVQEQRLHAVDADMFLRPGPRVFAAAEWLRTILHPSR